MAWSSRNDSELIAELRRFGEKVTIPIRSNKRSILWKKLNHLRARESQHSQNAAFPSRSQRQSGLTNLSTFSSGDYDDDFDTSDLDRSYYLGSDESAQNVRSYSEEENHDDSLESIVFLPRTSSRRDESTDYSPFRVHHRTSPQTFSLRSSSTGDTARRKSFRYWDVLRQALVVAAMIVVCGSTLTYVVLNKDYLFTWFFSSQIDSQIHNFKCSPRQHGEVLQEKEIIKALEIVKEWFSFLSQKKGDVQCYGLTNESVSATVAELKAMNYHSKGDIDSIYLCCIELILNNPHLQLRPLTANGSVAHDVSETAQLESTVGNMNLQCRLRRSFVVVCSRYFPAIVAILVVILLSKLIRYKLKQREIEQREMFDMVAKIIDRVKQHCENWNRENSEPYLAVEHVRDELLPPPERQKMMPLWVKAVAFIAANESRIQLKTKLINGEEFTVWQWLLPSEPNGRTVQGEANDETDSNGNNVISSRIIRHPFTSVKIRNMVDSNASSRVTASISK